MEYFPEYSGLFRVVQKWTKAFTHFIQEISVDNDVFVEYLKSEVHTTLVKTRFGGLMMLSWKIEHFSIYI